MRQAVQAEWTKLRTVAGPAWLLAASAVLTLALGAVVVAATPYSPGGPLQDTTKLSLSGVQLGQAVVAVLATGVISAEYGTGMIHVSLTAVPRRLTLLAAKAFVVAAVTLVAGAVGVLSSLLVGRLVLSGRGFTAAHGYAAVSLGHGPTLRAATGSVLYLVLVALLALGIATAVRESAVAVGGVLGLLYLFPAVLAFVSDSRWHRHLEQISPMLAGLDIQSTINVRDLALSPWAGLGVLAAWATGALLLGAIVLHVRDA